jgi:hypothetical protein
MYKLFAQAIRDGESHQPTFETAVDLHRLVDAIKLASDNGREVTFGQQRGSVQGRPWWERDANVADARLFEKPQS